MCKKELICVDIVRGNVRINQEFYGVLFGIFPYHLLGVQEKLQEIESLLLRFELYTKGFLNVYVEIYEIIHQ